MPGAHAGGFLAYEGHSTVFHIFIYYYSYIFFFLPATCSFPYVIERRFVSFYYYLFFRGMKMGVDFVF